VTETLARYSISGVGGPAHTIDEAQTPGTAERCAEAPRSITVGGSSEVFRAGAAKSGDLFAGRSHSVENGAFCCSACASFESTSSSKKR
jgi:hypothetical protein